MEQFQTGLVWPSVGRERFFFFIKARSVYEKLRYYKRYGKHHKDITINILNQGWAVMRALASGIDVALVRFLRDAICESRLAPRIFLRVLRFSYLHEN